MFDFAPSIWLRAFGVLAVGLATAAAAQPPLRIVTPTPEEMVHDNTGRVPVFVTGAPSQARLQPLLDGAPHGPPRTAPAFELEGVPRGEHRLQVLLLGPKGNEMARTAEVVFYVWQASVKIPRPAAAVPPS